jgi:hypothetical protein
VRGPPTPLHPAARAAQSRLSAARETEHPEVSDHRAVDSAPRRRVLEYEFGVANLGAVAWRSTAALERRSGVAVTLVREQQASLGDNQAVGGGRSRREIEFGQSRRLHHRDAVAEHRHRPGQRPLGRGHPAELARDRLRDRLRLDVREPSRSDRRRFLARAGWVGQQCHEQKRVSAGELPARRRELVVRIRKPSANGGCGRLFQACGRSQREDQRDRKLWQPRGEVGQ